jgi:thiol-disulfide isomerase/thioredoxin
VSASTASAQAGDPVRGRALYADTRGAPLSCGQDGACHGPDPSVNQYRVLRGADDAARILAAIGSVRTGMAFLQPYVDERDAIDLAAYLGEVSRGRPVAPAPAPAASGGDGASSGPATTGTPTQDAVEPQATSPFNAGYGGCALGLPGAPDPLLPLVVLVAAARLVRRRPSRAAPAARMRVAALTVGSVLALASPAARAVSPGELAPDFALPGLDGDTVALGAGPGRVVWLDFWASWCAPCRLSMPWMARMQQRHGAAGLRVVAVALDTDPEAARRFARREGAGLAIAFDPAGTLARTYAIRAMPTSVLIDADGRVLAVHAGFRASDAAPLERRIERALETARAAAEPGR